MNGSYGFPRRKRQAPRRTVARGLTATSGPQSESAPGEAAREAFDIARYVADITAQLEAMAAAADLDLLTYFLGMARAEAELFLRTTAEGVPTPDASHDEVVARPQTENADPLG